MQLPAAGPVLFQLEVAMKAEHDPTRDDAFCIPVRAVKKWMMD
jgi:hypothetical protein